MKLLKKITLIIIGSLLGLLVYSKIESIKLNKRVESGYDELCPDEIEIYDVD